MEGRERRDSDGDSETSPDRQRSLESSWELMNVDGNCSGIDNDINRNLLTQRRSLDSMKSNNVASDESGICLESPLLQRPIFDYDDNEASDIENIVHSPPRAGRMVPNIKIKIPLNIFKIDLEKVDRAIDKKDTARIGETKSNKERIDFLIETANPKPKLKRKRGQRNPVVSLNNYMQQSYKGYFDPNNKFELLLYRKWTYKTDDETGDKIKKLHKIRFLYRADSEAEEIFALPSGSGRSVVMKWADTNFPLSIASAVLNEKSVTEKEVKNLFENRYLTRFKMKKGESLTATSEFHLRFAPQIYTKFHANIKDGNDELKEILGHAQGSKVTMQVQLEAILFPNAAIDINNYSELCEKLSAIYNNPNLPRSREFDGYLSKVSKNRQDDLDKLLLAELDQFFRLSLRPQGDDAFGKLKNFFITQKNSTKYFEAEQYQIYYKSKLVKTFSERPQLQDLHPIINKNFIATGLNSFIKSFDALKISTTSQTSEERMVKENLFNCLEGVFYDDEAKKNYWRVGSNWYEVSGKYSFDVYAEYVRVLKSSLLRKEDCSLKFLWPLKPGRKLPEIEIGDNKKKVGSKLEKYRQERYVLEGDYNRLYSQLPLFVDTDAKVAPHGLEICDLFQYIPNPKDKSTILLYVVKKVMGADGYRVAICQTLSSIYYLYDSFQKDDRSEDSPAVKLFNHIRDSDDSKNKEFFRVYPKYEKFLEQLRNATFVFSPIFESGERELAKDYSALLTYDFSDFEEEIEPEFRESLKIELKSFLLDSVYIYPDGEFTQKWYNACAVVRDKGFHVKNDRGRWVDPFPRTSNLGPKQLRRILKEKYYKTVDGLAVKQLIVHLSEVLKFLGFGFKICQIEGEGDDLLHNLLLSDEYRAIFEGITRSVMNK